MKKARLYNGTNWQGATISEYGLKNGYIDYQCLADIVGNKILANNITELFYSNLNNSFIEPVQVNGIIDNRELIEQWENLSAALNDIIHNSICDQVNNYIENEVAAIQDIIDDLEQEQDTERDIFQYYIISENGAMILQDYTSEIVYYIPILDIYVWGVTHFGTPWENVLTDIKIERCKQ